MRDTATVPVAAAPVPLIDLQAQRQRLGTRIEAAITRVLDHGAYIMGPEVFEAEKRLAAMSGAQHVVTCSNGTTAMIMALMAWDIGRGDAVFVPSFTFTATAEVAAVIGATPVFVDVLPDTFNMDPDSLVRAIAVAEQTGLKPRVVIPVDLFGQPADHDAIRAIADKHGLLVLDDAAQSFGASYKGRKLGAIADVTATSFYPSKPLGCYGDGGAVFTSNEEWAKKLMQVRVHGQGRDRNENVRVGLTARFDSIQAAVLLEKIAIFEDECQARDKVAARYDAGLKGAVTTPFIRPDSTCVWAQYTISSPRRDRIVAALTAKKISSAMFYAKPIHLQTPYRGFPVAGGGLPVTEKLAHEVVSLPMHPYLKADVQDEIIATVRGAAS
ncbi:MAG: DegT/DnrJ/EryC1/StrS family aminotransferase [Rhodospirillaceae bacterium]|nr:DegT/DnrJ/EryC1/StrS family aminotransferase [Rhodospirillaceae bacterium]